MLATFSGGFMNILITGITSMHGWPIYRLFDEMYPHRVFGIYPHKMASFFQDKKNVFACNMEDFDNLKDIFDEVSPRVIIHAGGICDLDLCEETPQLAYDVNVTGAQNIVRLMNEEYLLYISSDLVFCGTTPYKNGYHEDHSPTPISVIGKTYLQAEEKIKKSKNYGILRIGLPIGESLPGTKGAIDFIEKRLKNKKKMTLFYDEIRSLIHTQDLACGVFRFVEKRMNGLFHFGGPKKYSLYDIGKHLLETYQYPRDCLVRASRFEDVLGLPRVGDISLDSSKFYQRLDFVPGNPFRKK